MTTQELLKFLNERDIRLWCEANQLRYDAPQGAITPEIRETIVACKAEIIEFLTCEPGENADSIHRLTQINTDDGKVSTADPIASLHRPVEEMAARFPNIIAVSAGFASLNYYHLNARANQLAHRLRLLGVARDSRVGVLMPKTPDAIVALLAVLKAGGGYVPLDPALPEARLLSLLDDANVTVLLTQNAPPFSHRTPFLSLEAERESLSCESIENLRDVGDSESLAYVVYTSGSTGKPKGVEMPRRPLHNLLCWVCETQKLKPGTPTLQFPSLSFDVHHEDIFSTLWMGGTLVLTNDATRRDPVALWQKLIENKIERIYLPVVMLHGLAEAFDATKHGHAALKRMICAGEALVITPKVRAMFAALPDCRLFNEYGPSETHVVTAFALSSDPRTWAERPSIGTALPNVVTQICDENSEPVSVGTPGELWLGGAAPARGYLNDPRRTEEKFVSRNGKRFYRTGDRVQQNPDGTLTYLGREDDQVKIRGFRVEPGEIESVLRTFPGVQSAVVLAKEYGLGDRRLIAYLVSEQNTQSDEAELRRFLGERLPEYMIPAHFVTLENLPVNTSGKIDRTALPVPEPKKNSSVAELDSVEGVIQSVWRTVLGREDIGLDDNFFDCGGHSLLITQVQSYLTTRLNCEIEITDLFAFPTVRTLASRLGKTKTSILQSEDLAKFPDNPLPSALQERIRLQREVQQNAQQNRAFRSTTTEKGL